MRLLYLLEIDYRITFTHDWRPVEGSCIDPQTPVTQCEQKTPGGICSAAANTDTRTLTNENFYTASKKIIII